MQRTRGSGRGTLALGFDRSFWSPPRTHQNWDEAVCHPYSQGCSKLVFFALLSLFKGNTTHGRRLMQFISSAFSNWTTDWYFSNINPDIATTLCTHLSICFKTLKGHKVDREGNLLVLLSCINNIGPSASAQVEHRPSQQHSTLGIRSSILFFQSCQIPVAWPQISYFRFPNIIRSLKFIFVLFRRKGIKKGTFPWGPSLVISTYRPHKHVKQVKASQRVFSQVFTVTQVKISNYVLERGQQNPRCKQKPEIHKEAVPEWSCVLQPLKHEIWILS